MNPTRKRYFLTLVLLSLFTVCAWPTTISKELRMYPYQDPQELMNKAEEYLTKNITDSALICYTAVIGQFPDKIPDEYRSTVITALNGIGLIHYLNGHNSEAYSNFAQSIDLDERADSPGYINIAGLLHYYGDEEKSIEYLKKGFDAAVNNGNQYYLCLSFINLVNSAFTTGDTSHLKDLTSRFRASLKDKNTPESRYALQLAYAVESAEAGNYQMAVEHLKTVPSVLDGFFLRDRAIFDTNANIARMFQKANMADSAMHYMKKAEIFASSQRQSDMIIEITKELSSLCALNGDSAGWRKYRYRWLELQDSLFDIKGMREVHNLEMSYEAQRFGKKIEHLTIEKNFRMKLIILSVIGIVILTVMLIIVLRYNKKLVDKNHDLFQKNLDILALKKSGSDSHPLSDETIQETSIPADQEEDKNTYILSESDMDSLWNRIKTVMEDESAFCDQDFSMQKLAELVNSNTKYISQTINHKTGQKFTSYLSEKRIDVACQRFIDNETYGHVTLEAIIADVGYKSRSSFIKAFKRYTGLTPSEYRKIALEKATDASRKSPLA
ncbi:MAG: helix-turn-helix domain-containing protein [Muribaculaceae bacterium]|nr:helix-turn-helix domain-containing protein [Muribaculaceae bacterium]